MGNREDLLAGAVRCLVERGWANTTVRDIAAAAGGVSHAAIGYHFGSREALLNAALVQAIEDLDKQLEITLLASIDPHATQEQRWIATWDGLILSFQRDRELWIATVEALVHSEHAPDLRKQLADGQQEGRRGMTAALLGIPENTLADADVRTIGSVQIALLSGLMLQWLTSPEDAPRGAEVIVGLRTVLAHIPADDRA